ncbi:MAG: amino acid ABC transporter permease [Chloroflexota bacterium]|nr:MAG: amino acid ABC transporter permease [Chloroflexota bacterium]
MNDWPWWLLVAILLGLFIVLLIINNETWTNAFKFVSQGIRTTITLALVGYAIAIIVGMLIGLGRVASTDRLFGVIYYNFATFYVEIVRGIPMLVIILYVAFVAVPMAVDGLNALGEWLLGNGLETVGTALAEVTTRNFSNAARVAFALGIAYGAFEAEVIRAGIESVEKGQMEAARSLGMSYIQSMRYIILPQAIRSVMPALGNDFVAMVKDSSLASVLGVQDLTQLTKLYASSTFIFFQTWSITAFIYLVITVSLTRVVRWMERRLRRGRR